MDNRFIRDKMWKLNFIFWFHCYFKKLVINYSYSNFKHKNSLLRKNNIFGFPNATDRIFGFLDIEYHMLSLNPWQYLAVYIDSWTITQ